ncbi:hypothetical protein PENTCL1PPCAC_25809 [Pristionchus entomophagus]|uniref:Serpentine receptor class gamma n=1 Tax=Pristionchus entomophagus TaxID=358040 RepID=A0AAV5U9S4_9BILA|nr:hypothetical protein PENTCL1PPCAC_25809 [Pristionchus entomophagus]
MTMRLDETGEKYEAFHTVSDTHKLINASTSSAIQLGFGLVTCIVCLVLNILTYTTLQSVAQGRAESTRKFLQRLTFLVCLTQCLNIFTTGLVVIFRGTDFISLENRPSIFECIYVTSDFFSLGPAV